MTRRRDSDHFRAPGSFSKGTVRDLLTRAAYTGKNPYYGSEFVEHKVVKHAHPQQIFDGQHVALISEALFFRCHAIRINRGHAPQGGKKRRRARIYLLSGLLDCARCGGTMTGQAGGRNYSRRYACSSRLRRKACDQPSMLARIPETQVVARLATLSFPPHWVDTVLTFMLDHGGTEVLERRRQILDENFALVQDQYDQDEIDRRTYLRAMRAYQRRLQALDPQSALDVDQSAVRHYLADFGALWEAATLREKRGLLQTLLKHARVDGKQVVSIRWNTPFAPLFPDHDA